MTARGPAIVFVGVHREALEPLRWLVRTRAHLVGLVTLVPKARATLSGAVDLEPEVAAAKVPVLRVRNVNDPACVSWIRAHRPAIVLVIGWTQLLGEDLLRIPRIACLGFHASLLPRYRGRAPINWALINGETETGNTLMVLEPGADEGDIVAQRRIPITDDDDCGTLYDKVGASEVDMLAEVLPRIAAGSVPRRKQDSADATVMPRRRPEDGGIDWALPARRVFNWVRALTHPYPGAFCHLGGRRLWIWKAALAAPAATAERGRPGALAIDAEGWPVAATGDGWIRLVRVQLEGEPEMTGAEATGRFLRPGAVLEGVQREERA
jgi:methionyl-tRNA formyltransferase